MAFYTSVGGDHVGIVVALKKRYLLMGKGSLMTSNLVIRFICTTIN